MIHPGFLLLLLGLALLQTRRERELLALGVVASGLGLAAAGAYPAQPLPAGFAAVEAALLATGAVLAVAAAATALGSVRTSATLAGSAAAAMGGVAVALKGAAYFAEAPVRSSLLALGAIAGLGGVLVLMGRRLARLRRRAEPSSGSRALALGGGSAGSAAIGIGTLLGAAAPNVGLVFLGAIAAAAGGWLERRAAGSRPLPIAPVLTLLLLPAWWLMRTIAGPEGLAVASLPDLPWSPAAERLLALVLLLAAWAITGLWPLHSEEPPALTAPVAALLVARVALPAFPAGLEHWRPLIMPVVVVGLWHAVLTGRRASALAALAWIGLAAAQPIGELGAGLILVANLVFELIARFSKESLALRVVAGGAATLVAGQGALLAVVAGFRAEVVYTVLAVAALVVAAAGQRAPQASTASEPSATAPSA